MLENKQRCQSCGMPISADFKNFGTNSDGSPMEEYCLFCFQNGDFTQPNQTLAEMIQSSIDNMTNELGMPFEKASELANSFIPTLNRWKATG